MKPGAVLLLKEGVHGSTAHMIKESELVSLHVPALSLTSMPGYHVVDTTGAGDAYTGALAV